MNQVQPVVDKLTAIEGVIESATEFVNTVPGLIQEAVDDAIANGATAEQLAPLSALADDMQAKADALVEAIAANPKKAPTPES